jgi:hypothetical protein
MGPPVVGEALRAVHSRASSPYEAFTFVVVVSAEMGWTETSPPKDDRRYLAVKGHRGKAETVAPQVILRHTAEAMGRNLAYRA